MKRGLFLLPLLALLLLPTACGSSDTDVLNLDPVASAASLTTDAGSARMSFDMRMTVAGETRRLAGAGAFDFEGSRGTMTMDLTALLPPGSGDGRVEARMVGTKIYMRMPAGLTGGMLPAGKPWFALDVQQALSATGLGGLDLTNLQQDPSQMLRLLTASSTDVREAGEARVRGVSTTRYTANLDLAKAAAAGAEELGLSAKQIAELRRAVQQLSAQTGLKTVPLEVYVDSQGLLRRLSMNMNLTRGPTGGASAKVTTDFFDFGLEVDVAAPPASQVFELTP